jgi:tetratricopeptide (TPR) repeat protein
VRDVIARRLTHLSPECNRVLVLASVLGREFALSALASIGDAGEDELLDLLDEAMAARVVSDVPGAHDRLRFAHVLIRDTLYESLTTVRRAQLHRLVAGALEALYAAEEGPHLAELAHHCIAGGDFPRGVGYARRAGDRAVALVAYEEAARLYETALGALDPGDEPARCAVLLGLVDAQTCAGNPAPARQASLDAADIARRHGLPRELALAAAGYGGRIVWARAGSDARLIPLLEEGLAALGDADVGLRVRLLARLAGALRDERSRERRDAVSRQAVELARGTGEPAALAFALDGRAAAILAPDTLDECVAIAGELIEVAGRCGDTERVLAGHFHRSSAQIQLGGLQEAEADLMVATRIVEELRQPVQVWQVWTEWTMLDLAAGRLAGADKRLREASAPGERALPEAAVPVHRLQRYTLCDFRGGLDEVEPDIRDLVASYPQRTVFRCVLAHLHARLGRAPQSRRLLDEIAPDRFAALPFDQEWLFAMSFLAEASALSAGHRAAVLYELLAPWAAHNAADQGEGIRGSVARYAGLLAASMERWDEAAEHFEAALAANARMGTRPWLARTQEDYAAILGERDPVRAQELFDAACATYDELGVARGRRWQRSHA